MTNQPLWLRDLLAYSIQAAVLAGVGIGMVRLLRIRVPRVRLAYWQSLLAICLFLPLLQPWRQEALAPVGTALASVNLAAGVPAASSSLSLEEAVLLVLCAGIAVRALWMTLGMVRLWLYRRQAHRVRQLPRSVAEAQRLVSASADIFISPRLQTPVTFGVFRPAILFPACFLEMEPTMQKAIALHELLHVERRDWLWNLAEEAVLTLLWFHVPLWWVVRSARLGREQVVDAEAVRRGKARRPYLEALLEMAGQKRLAERLPATLFLREGQLAERVELMVKEVHMSRKQTTFIILSAAGVLLIAGVSVVWAFPLKTATPVAEAAGSPSATSKTAIPANVPSPGNPMKVEADSAQKNTKVYKNGGKVAALGPFHKPDHQSSSAVDPSPQVRLNSPESSKGNRPAIKIDQAKIQHRIEQAMKGAKIAQEATEKLNSAETQRQLERAMEQAKAAQQAAVKIDHVKIQRQVKESMKRAKLAEKEAGKINQATIQRQVGQAVKQAKIAEKIKKQLNKRELQRQIAQAMDQAKIAQQIANKVDKAEIERQVEEALKQTRAAQKAAEKAQQKLKNLKLPPQPTPPASPLPPSPPPQQH